jgi:hypothetical protein
MLGLLNQTISNEIKNLKNLILKSLFKTLFKTEFQIRFVGEINPLSMDKTWISGPGNPY